MSRRRGSALIRARCRFRDEDGNRCETRIEAGQALCDLHREESETVKKAERQHRAVERELRRREGEIAAYRKRLDPGPLVDYKELLA